MSAAKTRTALAALLMTLAVAAPGPASAFEMAGFKAGMSRSAFVARARALGYEIKGRDAILVEVAEAEWAQPTMIVFDLERKAPPHALGVGFCGDRLRSVAENGPGGLDAFTQAISQARSYLGPGRTGRTLSNPVAGGRYTTAAVEWTDPSGESTHTVAITSFAGRTTVSRGWSARMADCPEE